MWETLFDSFMLNASDKIVINCPTEELEREWGSYEKNFCYYVNGTYVRRGPKSSATEQPWREYKKCTFYGDNTPDFDTATDDELRSFLGV